MAEHEKLKNFYKNKKNRKTKTMKTLKSLLFIAIAIFGFSAISFGQQSSATLSTATATAKIITPITLSLNNSMDFGTIAASTGGGSVVLGLDNSRVATGLTLGVATGVQAASFTAHGDAGATYSITLPADGVVKLHSAASGSVDMNVNGFNRTLSAGTLSAGSDIFKVGATLIVNPNQTQATDYSATFSVTVNYN